MKPTKKWIWMIGLIACSFILTISSGVLAGSFASNTKIFEHRDSSSILIAANETNEPPKEIPTHYKLLKKAMDQFFAVIESIANDKTLTPQQQQAKVEQFIMTVRWGPEKKDSFWAMDVQGKMLVNVYQPDLVGKDLSSFADTMGIKPFAEAIRIIREQGEGYLNYQWPRYEGKMSTPHTAFVRLFTQWDKVYGTHVPTDLVEGYEEAVVVLYVLDLQNQPPAVQATGGQTN